MTDNIQPTPSVPNSLTPGAPDVELPMSFYLGREYDLRQKKILDAPIMYDARDLTTHGVVVGMTGSGKNRTVYQFIRRSSD